MRTERFMTACLFCLKCTNVFIGSTAHNKCVLELEGTRTWPGPVSTLNQRVCLTCKGDSYNKDVCTRTPQGLRAISCFGLPKDIQIESEAEQSTVEI